MMITEKFISLAECQAYMIALIRNNPNYRIESSVECQGWDIDYPWHITVILDGGKKDGN